MKLPDSEIAYLFEYIKNDVEVEENPKIIFDNNSIRQEKAGFMKFLSAEMLNIKERSSHA